jgi:hypothetical protein
LEKHGALWIEVFSKNVQKDFNPTKVSYDGLEKRKGKKRTSRIFVKDDFYCP